MQATHFIEVYGPNFYGICYNTHPLEMESLKRTLEYTEKMVNMKTVAIFKIKLKKLTPLFYIQAGVVSASAYF